MRLNGRADTSSVEDPGINDLSERRIAVCVVRERSQRIHKVALLRPG
jgi:hypothetical protein